MAGADLEREILKWLVAGGLGAFPGKHLILDAPSSGCFLVACKANASMSSQQGCGDSSGSCFTRMLILLFFRFSKLSVGFLSMKRLRPVK